MGVSRLNRVIIVAMLAAVSFVLLFIGFPVLPGFPFLKVDFANVPILIGTVLFGPWWGMATAGIAGLLDIIFKDANPVGILGVIANWMAAALYVLPIYYWTRGSESLDHKKRDRKLVMGIIIGTLLMTLIMSLANLFILLPLYMKLASFQISISTLKMVLFGVVPFNLIKGIIVGIVIVLVYFRLIPILRKNA